MKLFVAYLIVSIGIIAILLVFELIKWLWDSEDNIAKRFILVILLIIGTMTILDWTIASPLKYILAH